MPPFTRSVCSNFIMDKESLRPLVLEVLQRTPQTHLHAIETEIRKRTEDYERHDVLTVQEILWELLVQGILAPGKNSLNLNLPFVHVTEYGMSSLEDGAARLHDPEDYIACLQAACPRTAETLIETAREALLGFLAGRYASAIVMLGRAAEFLLARLAETLIQYGVRAGHRIQRIEAAMPDPSRLAAVVARTLAARELPPPFSDDAASTLRELRTLVDAIRSDDGGIRFPTADRDEVHARLLLFPSACRFIYDLITHLEGEPSA